MVFRDCAAPYSGSPSRFIRISCDPPTPRGWVSHSERVPRINCSSCFDQRSTAPVTGSCSRRFIFKFFPYLSEKIRSRCSAPRRSHLTLTNATVRFARRTEVRVGSVAVFSTGQGWYVELEGKNFLLFLWASTIFWWSYILYWAQITVQILLHYLHIYI